jgi:competence ComEA-like helix-hairpin-helix protein
VSLYDRRQLVLLLGLLTASGAGLAVREWRQARPELVERLERFDRDDASSGPGARESEIARPRVPALAASRPAPRNDRDGRAPLDLNRASAEELTRLPGVGPGLANRIVALRDAKGRFVTVDDLRKVQGLGRARLERLRPLLTTHE